MKYKGKAIAPPSPEIVAFPRDEVIDGKIVNNDLVFVVKAVLDYSEFEGLCPPPKPPIIQRAGETTAQPYTDEPDYIKAREDWWQKRTYWMFLKSIEDPSLTWERVNMLDPETWVNLDDELKQDAHLTHSQIAILTNAIHAMNAVDANKMKEAKERFLTDRHQVAASVSSSQVAGRVNTPSGVLANV